MRPAPFFSIITATYNAEKTLSRLLESLADQTCRDFNWIVQDGASTDDTVAIAERYSNRLPEILLESASDAGIYDAWNKALDRTTDRLGKWILFLGADDLLAGSDVLEAAKLFLEKQPDHILYCCGTILFFREDTNHSTIQYADVETSLKNLKEGMSIAHPSLLHSKRLFSKYKFSTEYKIAGDYDFVVKTIKTKKCCTKIDLLITKMSQSGLSATNGDLSKTENRLIQKKYFPVYYYIKNIKSAAFLVKMYIKNTLYKTKLGRSFWNKTSAFKKIIVK